VVIKKAQVRCELNIDGSRGKLLSVTHEDGEVSGYECSGKHRWQVEVVR
jgi:YD repeat-containing protein